jgi:hypothetical protein
MQLNNKTTKIEKYKKGKVRFFKNLPLQPFFGN